MNPNFEPILIMTVNFTVSVYAECELKPMVAQMRLTSEESSRCETTIRVNNI